MPSTTRQAVFHIGTHKTGTTTIQEFLRQNKAGLLERGVVRVVDDVLLTRTGEQRAAHRIAEALSLGERSPDWTALKDGVAALPDDLPLLLSSERIFRYLTAAKTPDHRKAFTDNLKTAFGETAVFVLYLRNFGDYFNSLMSERIIATKDARPPGEIVETLFHLADVLTATGHLEAEFGPGSVLVQSFDRATREEGGLLGQFVRALDWPQPDALTYPTRRLHSMPPANLLALKHRLNALDYDERIYVALRRQIAKLTARRRTASSFRVIDDALVDRILAECRARNPDLAAAVGVPEDVLFSDRIKSKDFVDIFNPDAEVLFGALLEFYQLSALGDDIRRVRLSS